MSRDWLAVYPSMQAKPKYRRLSVPARAALFQVWMLGTLQTPEATWDSLDELADLLDLDGYPAGVVDELVERGWLEVDARGRVLVHNWDQHQLAGSQAARRAYERDRQAEWRARGKVAPAPPPKEHDLTRHDMTGSRPVTPSRDMSHASAAIEQAWEQATGRSLIGSGNYAVEIVDDSARRHPEAEVLEGIRQARASFQLVPSTQQLATQLRNVLDPLPKSTTPKTAGGHTRTAAEVEGAFSR